MMDESDFIQLEQSKKEDRIIRTMYTPKEIVKNIQKHFEQECKLADFTRSEMLLLWDSYNRLIWWFKDD